MAFPWALWPPASRWAKPPTPSSVRLLARQTATSPTYRPASICTSSPSWATAAARLGTGNGSPGPTCSTAGTRRPSRGSRLRVVRVVAGANRDRGRRIDASSRGACCFPETFAPILAGGSQRVSPVSYGRSVVLTLRVRAGRLGQGLVAGRARNARYKRTCGARPFDPLSILILAQQLAEAGVVADRVEVAVLAHVAEVAVAQLDGPAQGLEGLVRPVQQGVAARQVVVGQRVLGAEL